MARNDVLLIHPPTSFNVAIASGYDNVPPLGILYLAAVLEKEGIRVAVLDDLDASLSLKEILEVIEKEKPKIIGISSTTHQIKSSVEIAKSIKDSFDGSIKVAIGGSHVSADPDLINCYPYFDFCVTGEADITFPILVKDILNGKNIEGVFKGEVPHNLDEIPFPAWHLIDIEKYKKAGLTRYPLLATRGCPFNCIFCSREGLSKIVRTRSANNIIEEMLGAYHYFDGQYGFCDDSFTLNKKKVEEFCDELIVRDLNLRWVAGGVRLDGLDENLLSKMVRAGCDEFCCGIESGNEEVRNKIIKKNITDKQIYDSLRLCNKYKDRLRVQLSFILGVPNETKEQMLETAQFPMKLLKMGIKCIYLVAMRPTVPFPGAAIFNQAIKKGIIDKNIIDQYINGELGDGFRDNWPVYVPKGITKEEMFAIRKKCYTSFYFSPYYIWRRIKNDFKSWERIKKDIGEALSIIVSGRSKASFY